MQVETEHQDLWGGNRVVYCRAGCLCWLMQPCTRLIDEQWEWHGRERYLVGKEEKNHAYYYYYYIIT